MKRSCSWSCFGRSYNFGRAKEPSQVEYASNTSDQVCRPRTQKTVESSKTMGMLFRGRGPAVDLDLGKLKNQMASKWNFIYNFDMKKHKKEALEAFAACSKNLTFYCKRRQWSILPLGKLGRNENYTRKNFGILYCLLVTL